MVQINPLQQIQNSLAYAVAPRTIHITPILRSLHWFKVSEPVEWSLLQLCVSVWQSTANMWLI